MIITRGTSLEGNYALYQDLYTISNDLNSQKEEKRTSLHFCLMPTEFCLTPFEVSTDRILLISFLLSQLFKLLQLIVLFLVVTLHLFIFAVFLIIIHLLLFFILNRIHSLVSNLLFPLSIQPSQFISSLLSFISSYSQILNW